MENQLLRNPDIYPHDGIIKDALGPAFDVYKDLIDNVTGKDFNLEISWNYYRDGKAWLCKVSHKKTTVFWLSVWEGFFMVSFYFNQKNSDGLLQLDLHDSVKQNFQNSKSVGKLKPLTFTLYANDNIGDVLRVVRYKKESK